MSLCYTVPTYTSNLDAIKDNFLNVKARDVLQATKMASFVRLAARHTRVLTANAMRCRAPTTHMRLISTSENKKDDMATAVERSFYPPTIKPEDDLRNKEEVRGERERKYTS